MNALAPVIAGVLRIGDLPVRWSERIEMRARLGAMPERLLADIGLEPAAVEREVRRPFWRPFGAGLTASTSPLQPTVSSNAPPSVPAALRPVARLPSATYPMLS